MPAPVCEAASTRQLVQRESVAEVAEQGVVILLVPQDGLLADGRHEPFGVRRNTSIAEELVGKVLSELMEECSADGVVEVPDGGWAHTSEPS